MKDIPSNLPPGFNESDYYPELRTVRPKTKKKPSTPPTETELEIISKHFSQIDEYDRRNNGRQFENNSNG